MAQQDVLPQSLQSNSVVPGITPDEAEKARRELAGSKKSAVAQSNLEAVLELSSDAVSTDARHGMSTWQRVMALERVEYDYQKDDHTLQDHPRALEVLGVVRIGRTSHSLAHFDVLLAPGRFMSLDYLIRGRIGQSLLRQKFGIGHNERIEWLETANVPVEIVQDKDFEFRQTKHGISVHHFLSDQPFNITSRAFKGLCSMLGEFTPVEIEAESWFEDSEDEGDEDPGDEDESNGWGCASNWQSFLAPFGCSR